MTMAYTSSPISLSYEDHYRLCNTLSSPTTKIVSAAPARLYEARSGAQSNAWAPAGIKGIVVFGYDAAARSSRRHTSSSTSYWFRIVDIRRGRVLWEHSAREIIEYEAEKPFFHVFCGKSSTYGFRFDEDEDAAVFLQEVTRRIVDISVLKATSSTPSSSAAPASKRSSKPATSQPTSSQRRPVDRSQISAPMPSSFEHVAHMGATDGSDFNVAPEWSKLMKRLEDYGVDADMVEENVEFIKGFLAGAEVMRSPTSSPKMKATHPSPSSSRTSSVESLNYAYAHDSDYCTRDRTSDRRQRNVPRKPVPLYQY